MPERNIFNAVKVSLIGPLAGVFALTSASSKFIPTLMSFSSFELGIRWILEDLCILKKMSF